MRQENAIVSFTCVVCAEDSHIVMGGTPIEEDLKLCWKCAEYISNHFWKKVSSKWLTYSDSKEQENQTIYRKKKIPQEIRWSVFERDGYKCQKCGSGRMLTADHIKPELLGGMLELDNLQTLCNKCNSSKGAKHG